MDLKEPYDETAENQAGLKEGVLNELHKTKQKLSEKEKENQDLENIMTSLNKKIDQLKTPEAQQRLKDGALRELHKAQDKIAQLEEEKDKLAEIAEAEKNMKIHEQHLKEGALAEVERLQDQKKLDIIEASIIEQRKGCEIEAYKFKAIIIEHSPCSNVLPFQNKILGISGRDPEKMRKTHSTVVSAKLHRLYQTASFFELVSRRSLAEGLKRASDSV